MPEVNCKSRAGWGGLNSKDLTGLLVGGEGASCLCGHFGYVFYKFPRALGQDSLGKVDVIL